MALDLSFTSLADIAQSGGGGRPVEIPLDEIIEDPSQPRTVFDEAELRQLADSIARVGVIQSISVRPKNAQGKHVIIFGARRYRASRLAGRDRIRAVVEDADTPDAYLQLVENIQRDDLKPMEIAAFVAGRLQAGDRVSAIAERLGKPKDWVSRYAAVAKMPDVLRDKLATSPIRAVYELFQAWREQPEAVEQLARTRDSFTDAEARRLAQDLRKPVSAPSAAQSPAPREPRPGPVWSPPTGAGEGATPVVTPDEPILERGSPAAPEQRQTQRSLAADVRRLERAARAAHTPFAKRLVTHYETLVPQFEQELAEPHEVMLARKAALMLIGLAAQDG